MKLGSNIGKPGQSANWYNNTVYNNKSANFNMLEAIDTSPANSSVPGTREVLHNNLAYLGTGTSNLTRAGAWSPATFLRSRSP